MGRLRGLSPCAREIALPGCCTKELGVGPRRAVEATGRIATAEVAQRDALGGGSRNLRFYMTEQQAPLRWEPDCPTLKEPS